MKRACATHVGLGHWVTVLDTGQPILRLVLGLNDTTVNKIEEGRLRVAVVLAQPLEELVGLAEVENVQRAPALAGANVEPSLALVEERQKLTQIEF